MSPGSVFRVYWPREGRASRTYSDAEAAVRLARKQVCRDGGQRYIEEVAVGSRSASWVVLRTHAVVSEDALGRVWTDVWTVPGEPAVL